MKTRELDYDLPRELIAQHPLARRDESRLLVYDRVSERVDHLRFAELPDVLADVLTVVNDTRVVPARILIDQPRGEVLLLEQVGNDGLWEGLARPTRRLRAGRRYGPVELREHLGEGRWLLRLHGEPDGETPLPPYITQPLADPGRVSNGLCRPRRLRSRADRRPALHSGGACTPGCRARDPARRARHVPPGRRRGPRRPRPSRRALFGHVPCLAPDRTIRTGSGRRDDDGARARNARAWRPARGPHRPVHHARLEFAAPTRC